MVSSRTEARKSERALASGIRFPARSRPRVGRGRQIETPTQQRDGRGEADAPASRAPLPLRWLLWHGAGQAGHSVQGFLLSFLFIYYNQVLELSGTLTGLGLACAIIVDGISDPIAGSWSDGYRSRWGRRHPFMFASVVPVAVLTILLFSPPGGLSEFGLFLWFTVVYALMRTALTFYNVPYLGLGAEVTQDYMERTRIPVCRAIIGALAALLVAAVGWNFVFNSTDADPHPQLNGDHYLPFAVVSALVMAALMAVSAYKTMDVIPRLPSIGVSGQRFNFWTVFRDLFDALRSVSFRSLFLGHLVCTVYWGTSGTLALHLKTFFWELDSFGMQWWHYAGIVGGIVGTPMTLYFNHLLDKKWTVILGVLGCVLAVTGPVMLDLAGLPLERGLLLMWLLVFMAFLSAFAIAPVGVTVASMMGDMADEHELRTGRRQEGVYFAAFHFAEKGTGAFAPLLAGIAVDIVQLDPGAVPGEVPAQVLFDFGLIYAAMALFVLFAIWVFWPYNLNYRRHAEIMSALSRRRASERGEPEQEAQGAPQPPADEGNTEVGAKS